MESHVPVTSTKIVVPRRRDGILTRQRLIDLLYELLDVRLIILAAPAGYGKTSLLVDLVQFAKLPVCWFSLDPLDQDIQRFAAHLIASISSGFPNFGKSSMAALQSLNQDQPNLDSLVSLVANDLYENVHEHFVVVLDDYHLVEESRNVTYFINQLIQKADENCHFIIASRTLLNLPDMTLLVARSQVGGLSFEELAFQPDEIQTLWLQNFHLSLSEAEAAELARESEGWITGLLLMHQMPGGHLADRLRGARVAGVGLYEYLAAQVLERQPEPVRRFLLRTSLLEEFDVELCREVIGPAVGVEDDWGALTEMVLRANLFIQPVGTERIYLRYHHLFRDFLQNRILHDFPQEAQKIQLNLAEAWARRGEWERSYAIYQRIGNTQALADLVERAGPSMISEGRLATLSEWLDALPEAYRSRPGLISQQGGVLLMRGRPDDALAPLDLAIQKFKEIGDEAGLSLALVRRSGANRFLGRYEQSLADAEYVTANLTAPSLDIYRADALMSIGSNNYHLGNLSRALDYFQQAYLLFEKLGDGESMAKSSMQIGMVSKSLGLYGPADKAYTRALDFYQNSGNLVWQANVLNNLGVLQQQRGNIDGAAASFEKAIQYARIGGYTRLEAYALTSLGDLYRDLDAFEECQEAYHQARPIALRINDRFLIFYLDLAEASLALATGQPAKAQRLLDVAWRSAETSNSRYQQNLCRLEQASSRMRSGDFTRALQELEECRAYFEKEGHRVQMLRSNFYLAAAYRATAAREPAVEALGKVYAALAEKDNESLVATLGRELRPHLETMRTDPDFERQAAAILRQVEVIDRRIPSLRRTLRRQSQTVTFGPPKVVIHTLGKIQVKINGRTVTSADWLVQMARDLFLMIVAHPDGMTKEEIGLIFWPESTPAELKMRFKNAIYRLRRAAGKDAILFDEGEEIYRFNRTLDYEEDSESFTREMELADKAGDVERKIYHYRAALRYYKGDFLPELHDTWVVARREQLKHQYMVGLLKMANLELERRQHDQAVNCIHRLLSEDPCLEEAHRLGMLIYAAMGNRAGVMRQYEQCRQALAQEFNTQPTLQTQQLYHTLTH